MSLYHRLLEAQVLRVAADQLYYLSRHVEDDDDCTEIVLAGDDTRALAHTLSPDERREEAHVAGDGDPAAGLILSRGQPLKPGVIPQPLKCARW